MSKPSGGGRDRRLSAGPTRPESDRGGRLLMGALLGLLCVSAGVVLLMLWRWERPYGSGEHQDFGLNLRTQQHSHQDQGYPGKGSGQALDTESENQRARAALIGAFVADAATMGLHWVYKQPALQDLLRQRQAQDHPEFLDPPANIFYQYETGSLSPYGDELLPLLQHLASHDLHSAPEDGGEAQAAAWTQHLYHAYKAYRKGRYLNKSAKHMMARVEGGGTWSDSGMDDSQANALVKVPAVVARYAGTAGLRRAVEVAVRAQQNNDLAVHTAQAAAMVLERVIMGSSIAEAVTWASTAERVVPEVRAQIKLALRQAQGKQDLTAVVAGNGLSCKLPDAWVNALVAVVRPGSSYMQTLRDNMVAGGDSCSRAVFIGALLAAQGGLKSVPDKWRSKVLQYQELEGLVDTVLRRRSAMLLS